LTSKLPSIKFAQRLCHKLTTLVDRKGSHTRAQTLSNTRHGIDSSQVQNHNQIAKEDNPHFIFWFMLIFLPNVNFVERSSKHLTSKQRWANDALTPMMCLPHPLKLHPVDAFVGSNQLPRVFYPLWCWRLNPLIGYGSIQGQQPLRPSIFSL
jgi:hypothetical protein